MSLSTILKTCYLSAAGNPWDETQPSAFNNQNPTHAVAFGTRRLKKPSKTTKSSCLTCLTFWFLVCIGLLILGGAYFFFPYRTNLAILGIDYSQNMDFVGRSDTLLVVTSKPFRPYVGVLSIPRDLWVNIPGVGENRINAAHFFAEALNPGKGPQKVIDTIQENFGVNVRFFIRFRFEDFIKVIDSMGGVDISLKEPMAGYEAGEHHMNGRKALAFARNRLGSDDFFRIQRNQLIIKSAVKKLNQPVNWWRIPRVFLTIWNNLDTNLPVWLWPRWLMNFVWVGPEGIDFHSVTREMVTPFTTDQGASVLLPDWSQILPLVNEVFSE